MKNGFFGNYQRDYTTVLLPMGIVLLNLILKGMFLGSNSLGGDEPFSVHHAQMDVFSIVNHLSTGNNPPLYELILHFWIDCFGISEFSVRVPSLIFNCITVLCLYKIGKEFFNVRVAVYASLMFVFSNYQIFFSHEARVYALMGMLTTVSMLYFLKIARNSEGEKRNRVVLICANVFLIYAHYFGFFVLLVQGLFILFSGKLRLEHGRFLWWSVVMYFVLYLPNITVVVHRALESSSGKQWVNSPGGLEDMYNIVRGYTNAPVVTVVSLVFLSLALLKYLLIKTEKSTIQTRVIIVWFLFPFLLMFLISYWVPIFTDRYLMFVSIAFCVLLAIACDSLIEKKLYRFIVPVIMCVLFLVTAKPNFSNGRNVRDAVAKMKDLEKPNTLVLFCPSYFMLNFTYYYDRALFSRYNTKDIYGNMNTFLNKRNIYGIGDVKQVDLEKYQRVVYLDAAASFSFPNNNILNTLEQTYYKKSSFEFRDIFTVYEFETK